MKMGMITGSLLEWWDGQKQVETGHLTFETVVLMPNCAVTSPQLGQGSWCLAGGSNSGFEIDF